MKRRQFSLSYANVISTMALFVALGGTAVATGVIDGKKIKRNSITGKQINGKSVPGADLRPNSVRGRQVRESTLARVPLAADAESAERAGSAETATRAESADRAAEAESAEVANMALSLSPGGAAGLIDSCPAGTVAYAGACIEEASRPAATWPAAARTCGDAGGRLPALEEMEGFRQQPGITLGGTEHTSTYLDLNGLAANGGATVGISDSGSLSPGFSYGTSNAAFRCVFPATNR